MFDAITTDEPAVPDTLDDTWLRDEYHDAALAEAIALLRHHTDQGEWPTLPEDTDEAFPPLQAKLDVALDQYEAIATHLLELQDEIRLLQGSDNTIDRGLVGLADDVGVSRMVRIFGRALMQSNSYQSTNKQRPKNRTPADLPP